MPEPEAHVELVQSLTRSPHEQPIGGPLATDAERADELLRLACLTYGADDAARPRAALALLAEHPHLSGLTLHTAAATGDVEAARRHLAANEADPTSATRDGGPFAWAPLLYVAYSRIDDPGAGRNTVGVARLLLDHGADPDAGYLWDGLPVALHRPHRRVRRGRGRPATPRPVARLAQLLLDAGADPNDSQTIYDRGLGDVVRDDTDWLELLLDHGLGPGRRRTVGPPARPRGPEPRRGGGRGPVPRGRGRAGGPGAAAPRPRHRSRPARVATRRSAAGRRTRAPSPAGTWRSPGCWPTPGPTPAGVDATMALVGALLAADRDAVAAAGPDAVARVRAERPDLVAVAAERGRPEAIRILVAEGWDVSHLGRLTALHEAAYRGDRAVVDLLLALGADPTITEHDHGGTPQGWARFAGHTTWPTTSPPPS